MKRLFVAAVLAMLSSSSAHATDLDCISTTFNALSPNDKVCVSVFEDPQVPGVVCHISQARKGGWGQPFGLNEDPSNFSVSCRQIGPINVDLSKLQNHKEVFSEKTSIFFQDNADLSHGRQTPEHARLRRDQHQDRQRLAGECDQHRSDHAMAALT
jgi:CreA protein